MLPKRIRHNFLSRDVVHLARVQRSVVHILGVQSAKAGYNCRDPALDLGVRVRVLVDIADAFLENVQVRSNLSLPDKRFSSFEPTDVHNCAKPLQRRVGKRIENMTT